MVDRAERLISEIRRLRTRHMTASEGRHWPEVIKERVAELEALGLSAKELAARTGLSYHTIVFWRDARRKTLQKGFHEVRVKRSDRSRQSESEMVTAASETRALHLKTPAGFVIGGLDENGVCALIQRLSDGGTHAS